MEEESSSYQTIRYTQLSGDSKLEQLFKNHEIFKAEIKKKEEIQQNLFVQQEKLGASPPSLNQSDLHRGYNSDPQIDRQSLIKPSRHTHIINKKQKKKTKKRTRMYIQMLESRVSELQAEIDRLRKINKINREYINRLKGADSLIDGFFVGRQQIFEKLEYLNSEQEKQSQDKNVYEVLTNLRVRQGVFGKDRLKTVNYYFKEMIEMLLPEIQKYIIKTAIEESDLFDSSYIQSGRLRKDRQVQQWRKDILEQINLSKQSKNKFYSLRPLILKQTNQFKNLLADFYKLKCRLTEKARILEKTSDNVHHAVNPKKLSKVLCYIDKYKYEKNVSLESTFGDIFDELKKEKYCYDQQEGLFVGTSFDS